MQDTVDPLLKELKKSNMEDHLTKFTSFHTRYYKSDYGRQSSEWLLAEVQDTIKVRSSHNSIYFLISNLLRLLAPRSM